MSRITALLLVVVFGLSCSKASIHTMAYSAPENDKPLLVVGITVDQMRYEYLQRFKDHYGNGGFKRLMDEGFTFYDHHICYAPTLTGPGHASIFTGTSPAHHGIIANDWFDKPGQRMVYCTGDESVSGVGVSGPAGQMSPHRLKSSTIGDELKLHTQNRSKVLGISLKDRGAILPAGHQPDGAYWFEGKNSGLWMTSTYYMEELPQWVKNFNAKGLPEHYMQQSWELALDPSEYDESNPDNNPWEGRFKGMDRPVFPYKLSELREANGNYELLKTTPFGNTLTVDFAIEAIKAEELGKDEWVDLLSLSFSAADYVGHQFGPHSMEMQDAYIRLDAELERFLNFLDETIGQGKYLVFLTADHGAPPVPGQAKKAGWPNDYFNSAGLVADIDSVLKERYGEGQWILKYFNEQFWLNEELIRSKSLSISELEEFIVEHALDYEGVWNAATGTALRSAEMRSGPMRLLQEAYNPVVSGNVALLLRPGWMEYGRIGTHHVSAYSPDTHIPLLFMGAGISQGESYQPSRTRDIAPTLCQLLKIPYPSACTGSPLVPLLEK